MDRKQTIAHLAECAALAAQSTPMTDDERREHLCRCAAEDARAEARRRYSPQLDLSEVGHYIHSEMAAVRTKGGESTRVAEYTLVEEARAAA